jgi:hypothetical protein
MGDEVKVVGVSLVTCAPGMQNARTRRMRIERHGGEDPTS